MKKFEISTSHPYDIFIGHDIIKHSGEFISECTGPCKLALITDSTVNSLYSQVVLTSLLEQGFHVSKIMFPAGEHSKNMNTYANILEALADENMTRSDAIVSLGGGVVGDIAGFVASTYMRGIPYFQIPTTYIAAIDASVGGKTGVNLLNGKNLAGAFWQPSCVICDYKTFDSLPKIRLMDGIAEAIKNAVVAEGSLIEPILADNYEYVIERCISIKKSVVEADERDMGLRQLLNFGHTIAHGIEKISSYSISHGHAVAIGMIVESRAAYRLGLTDCDISGFLTDTLTSLGFYIPDQYDVDLLYHYALTDKKILGDKITMVIPESVGKCRLQKISLSMLHEFIELGVNSK